MKTITSLFLLASFLSLVAVGKVEELMKLQELTLLDGKTYSEVTVTKIEADSISIIHSSGATRVPFEKLSGDDAEKLGLTQDGADKAREEKRKAVENREAAAKQAEVGKSIVALYFMQVDGKILQVLDGGVLLTDAKVWNGRHTAFPDMSKGVWKHLAQKKEIGTCLVRCRTRGLVDGQFYSAIVGETGTFTYTSTIGSARTVQAFQSDLGAAWEANALAQLVPKETVISLAKSRYSLDRLIFETPLKRPNQKK